jgi:hypothetical protein
MTECSNPACLLEKNIESTVFQRCSACKQVRYCSRACQAAHWTAGHKMVCSTNVSRSLAVGTSWATLPHAGDEAMKVRLLQKAANAEHAREISRVTSVSLDMLRRDSLNNDMAAAAAAAALPPPPSHMFTAPGGPSIAHEKPNVILPPDLIEQIKEYMTSTYAVNQRRLYVVVFHDYVNDFIPTRNGEYAGLPHHTVQFWHGLPALKKMHKTMVAAFTEPIGHLPWHLVPSSMHPTVHTLVTMNMADALDVHSVSALRHLHFWHPRADHSSAGAGAVGAGANGAASATYDVRGARLACAVADVMSHGDMSALNRKNHPLRKLLAMSPAELAHESPAMQDAVEALKQKRCRAISDAMVNILSGTHVSVATHEGELSTPRDHDGLVSKNVPFDIAYSDSKGQQVEIVIEGQPTRTIAMTWHATRQEQPAILARVKALMVTRGYHPTDTDLDMDITTEDMIAIVHRFASTIKNDKAVAYQHHMHILRQLHAGLSVSNAIDLLLDANGQPPEARADFIQMLKGIRDGIRSFARQAESFASSSSSSSSAATAASAGVSPCAQATPSDANNARPCTSRNENSPHVNASSHAHTKRD